jgi:hypothetical protein
MRLTCLAIVLATAMRCDSTGDGPLDPEDPQLLMGTIHGFVTAGDTRVRGAEVSLTGSGIARTAISDSTGFAFADLPPGVYTMTASSPDLACDPATTNVAAGESTAADIRCAHFTGTITGTVTAGDSPVSGIVVGLTIGRSATTNTDGTFVFDSVPVGAHDMTVTTAGANCGAASVMVQADQTASADIVCQPIGGFVVNARFADDGPLQWAFFVLVDGPETRRIGGILTPAGRSFGFRALPPGDYAVSAGVASQDLYCESAVASIQVGRVTFVDIECTFQPMDMVDISGHVTINGRGRELVIVELWNSGKTSLQAVTTTVSFSPGYYQFRNVTPGAYSVVIRPPVEVPCDVAERDATVSGNQEADVDFACGSGTTGSIAGFVDSENIGDTALAGRSVIVAGPADRTTITGPWNGLYAFDDLPPGAYVVTSWCGESMSVDVQAGATASAIFLCF